MEREMCNEMICINSLQCLSLLLLEICCQLSELQNVYEV